MSSLRILLFTFLNLSLLISINAQATCYFQKGSVAPDDTPCNPDQPHSQCCNQQQICLSNGLCFSEDVNRVRRGSCTDPSWNSGSCSRICTGANDTDIDMADVSACPGAHPGVWYCGYDNVDRCKGPNQDTFDLAPGSFADFRNLTKFTTAIITATATSAAPTSSNTRGSATSSTSTGTCNPTSIAKSCSSAPTSSGTRGSTTNSTSTGTCNPTSTSCSSAPTSSGTRGSTTNSISTGTCNPTSTAKSCSSVTAVHTGVEAGVGIPLILCMLASFLFYFRERRLRRKLNVAYEEALKHSPLSESEREYQQSLAQIQEAEATLQQTVFEAPQTPARIPELR